MGSLITLLFGIAVSSYAGYVFAHMWNWFVVPYFNVSVMSWGIAWGLMTIFNFLRFKIGDLKKAKQTTTLEHVEMLVVSILISSVIWGEGWFINWYLLS